MAGTPGSNAWNNEFQLSAPVQDAERSVQDTGCSVQDTVQDNCTESPINKGAVQDRQDKNR